VRFSLTPRDTAFYELFADAGDNLVVGAKVLGELLHAGDDGAAREAIAERMHAAEHAGDEATHAIFRRVNSSFVTPFDREDIYRLGASLDDVMDAMDEAVDFAVLYQLSDLPHVVADQVDILQQAAELTAAAMRRLRTMRDLSDYWIEINRLENAADQVYRRALAGLYADGADPLHALKLRDVVESLEAAADAFEHVAHTVESIAVKES
jgi:uncharacterized protein